MNIIKFQHPDLKPVRTALETRGFKTPWEQNLIKEVLELCQVSKRKQEFMGALQGLCLRYYDYTVKRQNPWYSEAHDFLEDLYEELREL